ncbi:MAG TPA: nickel-dependent hydrogenase large subunit [Acidobacteriaceae bacterium]|nr:nickel-dependent hydrogenase large subunit [Acidobacteriaceae bacterium]
MSYRIPMGPYHPALEEPYKLEMFCEGETVCDARLHIGFNFRGIEHLAESRNYIQVIALMERVCGICSNIHTLTLCQAMEQLTGLEPPPRALYIRVIMAELERLHSHILWAGIASKLMGFKTMFMSCFALREKIMDVLQAISGNRVNYAMNRIGGTNRDISDPDDILAAVNKLESEITGTVIPIFTTSATARLRCAGIGVLTHERAIACGVVGPTARASGVTQDIRQAAPYAAYPELDFHVTVESAGDVRARLFVRALEIVQSCRLLRQALTKIPSGPYNTGDAKIAFAAGTAISRAEAPRGEIVYSVSWKENSRTPARVHVRTPTYANMPAVRWMVQGARLADTPLIQASIDPCYSCTDR